MRLKALGVLALIALAAGCGRAPEETAGNGINQAIVPADDDADVGAPSNAAAPAPVEVEGPLDEMAGVQVGMTIADLRRAGFKVSKDAGPDPGNTCGYARIESLKDLFFMLDGDTVVRIEVDTPGHPTIGGVDIGMSEKEAVRRLGERAVVQPHPYTAPTGHYLVAHEQGAPFGLIAETDGKKVVSYRIGRWAFVRWKEGCS